jgi:hypothetical protein
MIPVDDEVAQSPPGPGAAVGNPDSGLEVLACDGCGRSFSTIDGTAMLAAIKGSCPDCDGAFELKRQSCPSNG